MSSKQDFLISSSISTHCSNSVEGGNFILSIQTQNSEPTSYSPCFARPKGQQYSGAIRNFLKKACKRTRILKNVTPYTLGHSYTTHMMAHRVALRHIQKLLGHAQPETTMIYTHVSLRSIGSSQPIGCQDFTNNKKCYSTTKSVDIPSKTLIINYICCDITSCSQLEKRKNEIRILKKRQKRI